MNIGKKVRCIKGKGGFVSNAGEKSIGRIHAITDELIYVIHPVTSVRAIVKKDSFSKYFTPA